MHATFVAAGPGIRKQGPVKGVRAVDLAPTISFLLGIPGPVNARGKILYKLFPSPGQWKEATILYISDFHGQLTPLSAGRRHRSGPSFGIGGAAYLKPWFDTYRAEAMGGLKGGNHITLAGGDSVGATPPISNFFGDKPTMTVLNMIGMSADTLGNHNFDRGSAYLRTTLIPLANFPYLSANTVFASNGKLPASGRPSKIFNFDGFKLGRRRLHAAGARDADLPRLPRPVQGDRTRATAINAEAASLRAKGKVNAVVAVGHIGGDGTDVDDPDRARSIDARRRPAAASTPSSAATPTPSTSRTGRTACSWPRARTRACASPGSG